MEGRNLFMLLSPILQKSSSRAQSDIPSVTRKA